MTERYRVVVIGGGITGCSVAYHLARAGWTDVLLVDKGELTSGSTAHAAGLVTMFNPSPTMMRFRRYSIELYRELGVFETVGSLRFASSPEQLLELKRGASRARGIGLDVELLGPSDARDLMPAASSASLHGAVWVPGDGFLDPHTATHALATGARALGVTLRTGARVEAIELTADREVSAVVVDGERIGCEVVVNAAGMWAPRVAAMVGAAVPSTPVDHQHVALRAVPGDELPRDMPCFRDPDNLVYGKSEAGGLLFGGYEGDPVARWVDGVPWEHGSRSLPPDQDRFEPLMRGAIRRFPFLEGAEVVKLVCHPDAMTPDADPLLGPIPGTRGFFLAAGLSLNGFGGAGGIGKAISEWVTSGETELDLTAYRAWRFGAVYRDPVFAAERAREAYRYYYLLRYPFDQDEWGRPRRVSPLHGRLQDLGAVFGAKGGWERAEHLEPGGPWRRAGADQRAYGWTRPPWFERVGAEHAAFRERAGLIDLTSFGKIEVAGAGALPLLERACDNRIDRPVGAVVYGQFLDQRAGIVADVTITRLGLDRFRVVTGSGTVDADLGWLRMLVRADDGPVELREASEEHAVIGLWGPVAREILQAITEDDISSEAFGYLTGRDLRVGTAPVFAQRVSYVGELGWELWVEPRWAVHAWDAVAAAAAGRGLEPCGYRALDGLRLERGYRYFGTDLTAGDTPDEAGLSFCVDVTKDFVGRDAVLAAREAGPPRRRLRTLTVGDGYVTAYGGEAVHAGGEVVGRVRSAAFGYTVDRMVATAYLPADFEVGDEVRVEVFGDLVPGQVADDVLVAPGGKRMRA
ncbi:MAG TPA: FAD-dependent oxidoreductase [Actinomycetota bacterium]|nr:FAD-dependent oxidoreductase [Actinomycetota bacterium]